MSSESKREKRFSFIFFMTERFLCSRRKLVYVLGRYEIVLLFDGSKWRKRLLSKPRNSLVFTCLKYFEIKCREHLSRRDRVGSSAKSNHALKCNSKLVSLYFWSGIFTNVVHSFVVLYGSSGETRPHSLARQLNSKLKVRICDG